MTIRTDVTKNERKVIVELNPNRVVDVLALDALREAGLAYDPRVTATVKIKQETEGSPSYNVDKWSAYVTLIVDLDAKAEE